MRGKRLITIAALAAISLPVFAIRHIRWGSSAGPLNGLTITWTNNGTSDSIRWGYTPSYEMGAFAGIMRNGYSDKFFKHVFPTVNPNSTIYYQLYDSNTQSWGMQKTFAAAPPSNTTAFSFCALGDSRNGLSVWQQVSNLANSQAASFTLYNGDIVDNGGSASEWNNWFNSGTAYLENNIVYHALGNHDAQSVPTYKNIFDLPHVNGSNLYYSFTYGNALFITLNSEDPANQAQASWLVSTLSAAASDPSIIWKVVSFHRPFYTIGAHAGEMNAYFGTWWKAFDDYGVDLIVNGHDHMYERTKPINRNVSTGSPVASYGSQPGQGRCQIVCGGAGAPLYTGTPTWAIEKYQSKYNFCKFSINGYELCGTTYDNYGNIIDTFCINKSGPGTGFGNSSTIFNSISVYPNPVQSMLTIDYFSSQLGEATILVYNMAGQEVVRKEVLKEEQKLLVKLDMSVYARGAYTVQVVMGRQKDNLLIVLQ
ncbi:MAG: metallophosphoesterase [Bacteroidota bacterium]